MRKRNLLIIIAGIALCLILARHAMSVSDRSKTYEVEPWITTPPYQTDASRAIDAYERLMERYMDSMDEHLNRLGVDCQAVSQHLDSIDAKLEILSARLARIEKALAIDPNAAPSSKTQPSKTK